MNGPRETVTEGLFPNAVTSAMQIDDGQDPKTLDPDGTRDQKSPASDGRLRAVLRTMVVERSSGEETVTSKMRVGLRPSIEAEPATSSMLPRERYTRQTLHPVHMRRSGPILQLIELRRMYSRRMVR